MRRFKLSKGDLAGLILCSLAPLAQVAAQEVLKADLAPLIERAAQHRERFAVDLSHAFSTATHGKWSTSGATREWTYSIRIPSAVSLSFHAGSVELPASSRLTVEGGAGSATYRAPDISRGSLWGRPLLGDTLTFRLSVSAAELSKVRFEVASLQAGYRGLSGGVPDHPAYRKLKPEKAEAAAAACVQNFTCNSTSGNDGPGKATVAILIGNVAQCTGTLINNVREDGKPYVLTARHCQNGELGGGEPEAAASVSIYWDAVSACGETLGSLYSGSVSTQSGATTVVEQQDAWLIELDQAPRIPDAYYAGWDATGGAFVGGYSVHHALGRDKQYAGWHGQAILQTIPGQALDAPYDSDFWGVVNSVGNVGPGASGGALFDPVNRVVGSASLAYLVDGRDSEGVCPAAAPPAPSPSTITAQYTALSAVWDATSDASSTTANATLRRVLDPDGTGRLSLDGFGIMPMQLIASASNEQTDRTVTLSWNVPWAETCTASGSAAGGAWEGSKPTSGSAQVTEHVGGTAQYLLNCSAGHLRGKASASVSWIFITPLISLSGPGRPVMLGSPFELRWSTNVRPCTASDGVTGDGWAGAKSDQGDQTLTASHLGATTYSISCGSGARVAATQVTIQVVPPAVTLHADATRLRTGSSFNIWWTSDSQGIASCSGSGGTPGWAENTINVQSGGSSMGSSSAAGTFTYTMTCSGGGMSAASSITVEFVNEAAATSLVAVAPQQQIYEQGNVPDNIAPNLLWTSNQGFCSISSLGPVGNRGVDLEGKYPSGTATAVEFIAGTYEYELTCPGATAARTSIEWVTSNPRISIDELRVGTNTWVAGYEYQLRWMSNAVPCVASGGAPGDGWAGPKGNSVHATQLVTAPATPGTYTYSMTCGTGASAGTENFVVTVPPAAVSLTASPSSPAAGQFVTLQWDSSVYPCTANADGAGVSWGAANMSYAGQSINQQSTPGTYTYTIRCGSGTNVASASTQVTFRDGPATEFTADRTTAAVNSPVTLSWESGSSTCSASGGTAGDGWSGPKSPAGTMVVTSLLAGSVSYILNCSAGGQSVVVTYTGVSVEGPLVSTPTATMTASLSSQVAGQPVTISWQSTNSNACFASGGSDGDGWLGSLSLSGSMPITKAAAGTVTYTITCTGATPAATAKTTVTFTAPAGSGGSGDSGGGGGGGAFDRYWTLLLALMVVARGRGSRKRGPVHGGFGAGPGFRGY